MRPAPAHQAGFTLLEVLVALAILSLAVVASIEGFAQGLRLLKLSGDHQQAMLLADQKMREIIDPAEGQDSGTEGRFRWERTTKSMEAPDLAQPGSPVRGLVYEIDVRVNWDARRQIEIRTIRMGTTPSTTTTATTATTGTTATTPTSTSTTGPAPTGPTGPTPARRPPQ